LYEFPVIETEKEESISYVTDEINVRFADLHIDSVSFYDEKILHKLSHQHLNLRFFKIKINQKLSNSLPISSLNQYPFPIVLIKFVEKYLN
jgi:A/G-specific adenine glycosylase